MSRPLKQFQCGNCTQIIEVPHGTPKPANCPKCGAPTTMIHHLNKGPPGGRRGEGSPWQQSSPSCNPFFRPSSKSSLDKGLSIWKS